MIAAGFPQVGIGLLGVALAFGLTVVTMAYAIGHISGCHLNPAITVGLTAGGRFPAGQVIPYVIAQLIGAIVAALLLYVIAKGHPGFDLAGGFATNGYGDHSRGRGGGGGREEGRGAGAARATGGEIKWGRSRGVGGLLSEKEKGGMGAFFRGGGMGRDSV